ncbi:hypothetical protein BY996DRAFT_6410613 [Phakopsora pachyrhizi]|nr:hypothetical protein BY996DRAFT_6410613 [Phakopsora pachyrhizi]
MATQDVFCSNLLLHINCMGWMTLAGVSLEKFNLNLSTNLILICPIAACQLLTGSLGGIRLDHSPINSSILKWNNYYNQRASVVGFRLVPLFKTRKGVGGTTTNQSIKQHGHPERTFPGTPTRAVILPLTSILEWNGQDDSTNTLKLEAAAIFGLLCIYSITAITRDSPIGLILPSQSSTWQTEHHLLHIAQETDCKGM